GATSRRAWWNGYGIASAPDCLGRGARSLAEWRPRAGPARSAVAAPGPGPPRAHGRRPGGRRVAHLRGRPLGPGRIAHHAATFLGAIQVRAVTVVVRRDVP